MVSDTVRYYDDFLADRDWLAEGLSWAVVQPASAEATIDGVIERLRARRVEPGDTQIGELATWLGLVPTWWCSRTTAAS